METPTLLFPVTRKILHKGSVVFFPEFSPARQKITLFKLRLVLSPDPSFVIPYVSSLASSLLCFRVPTPPNCLDERWYT